MKDLWLWLSTGIEHITDLSGFDHILFVSLLAFTYCFKEWKQLVLLITAFTVGHSISLAISVVFNLDLKTELIEFLIAFSILITAVYHLWNLKKTNEQQVKFIYFIVVFFGLIHGLGFSFLLKAMLGKEESVVFPLLWFNLGLEIGQLIIVLAVIAFNFLMAFLFKIPFQLYKLIFVSLIGLVALKMCVERLLLLF